MEFGLSALIRKDNKNNMSSFEDLIYQQNITYGALRNSPTYRYMSISYDLTMKKMYDYINRSADNLVNSRQEGIEKTLNSNYAFIQVSKNSYVLENQ